MMEFHELKTAFHYFLNYIDTISIKDNIVMFITNIAS